ncbi:oxidoreductase-like domain-containing protein [Rhodanobacter sp. IGA1.0]|uniref:Oxidoreductase-like domain-containing protein n=1 Tax=Rhodanobacter sp. IGA1.0 TaxID=3158582 RepID=A0AAU7QQ23_9GAMM|nr:oxidoreductase-like domain-containing protein [Rhodanobacter spathiphylli]
MADPHDPPPVRPPEPDAADCCGEGCVRCVYDVHDEALERYERALAAWHARHPGQARGIEPCGSP